MICVTCSHDRPCAPRALAIAIAIAIAFLAFACGVAGSGAPPAARGEPELAPDFALEDINPKSATHGRTLALHDLYREHGVVLKFVASWCSYCREELPAVEKLARRSRVPVIYVAADEWGQRESMLIVAERHELTRPVLFVPEDAAEAFGRDWDHEVLPATYVIDAEGRIREAFEGANPVKRLAQAVERSLGG